MFLLALKNTMVHSPICALLIWTLAFAIAMLVEWISVFKIFREVYFIGSTYPDVAVYKLQNYMYNKLNYQKLLCEGNSAKQLYHNSVLFSSPRTAL